MDLEKQIQSKRHEELLKAMAAIKQPDKTGAMVSALETLSGKIELFIKAVKDTPAPQIKVETNQGEVVTSVGVLGKEIIAAFKKIAESLKEEEKPEIKEWVHQITKRDRIGRAEEIISKPKHK